MWLVSVALAILGFAAALIILAAGILHSIAEYHARAGADRYRSRRFTRLTELLKKIYRRLVSGR